MYKNLLYNLSKHNRLIQTIKLICNKLINKDKFACELQQMSVQWSTRYY